MITEKTLLVALHNLLKTWGNSDFSKDERYARGEWSRRNLDAMTADVEARIIGFEQKTHMVGQYVADYTELTPEELAQPTGAEELLARSKPVLGQTAGLKEEE